METKETKTPCPYNCDYKIKCRVAKDYKEDACPIGILKNRADKKYLTIQECINGHLYLMHARNSIIGIYDGEKKGFHYRRHKFNSYFLDIEYHWDVEDLDFFPGENLLKMKGTAKPVEDLGPAPEFKTNKEKELYLMNKTEEKAETIKKINLNMVKFIDGGSVSGMFWLEDNTVTAIGGLLIGYFVKWEVPNILCIVRRP